MRKRMFVRLLAIIAAVVLLPTLANAQATHDCNSNCPDTPPNDWTQYSFTVNVGGGCNVVVTYLTRINHCANPVRYEYQLVSLAPSGSPCTNVGALLTAAIYGMIAHNGPGFPPTSGTDPCNENVAISMASCWHWDVLTSIPPVQAILPCTNVCCSRRYRICYDATGRHISAVLQEPIEGGVTCPNAAPPYDCETYCDVLDQLADYDEPDGKRTVFPEQDDADAAGALIVTTSGATLTVRFDVGQSSVHQIELVDISGSIALRQEIQSAGGVGSLEINTKGLPSGQYHVVLHLSDNRQLVRAVNIVK